MTPQRQVQLFVYMLDQRVCLKLSGKWSTNMSGKWSTNMISMYKGIVTAEFSQTSQQLCWFDRQR